MSHDAAAKALLASDILALERLRCATAFLSSRATSDPAARELLDLLTRAHRLDVRAVAARDIGLAYARLDLARELDGAASGPPFRCSLGAAVAAVRRSLCVNSDVDAQRCLEERRRLRRSFGSDA